MARHRSAALQGLATAAAVVGIFALAQAPVGTGFMQLPSRGPALTLRTQSSHLARVTASVQQEPSPSHSAAAAAAAAAASAVLALAAGRPASRGGLRRRAAAGRGRVALAAWPWEDDDPYSKCTAVKLQVGMTFSKMMLDSLNRLAESADTSSEEGLHQLLLDVILALRRSESSWRYGNVERLIMDSEDNGREASAALQRWGVEAQSKWGDGEAWEKMDKTNPSGTTEFLIVTVLVSCYGPLCPKDEKLKVRSVGDVKKVLDAMAGVQVDELMQLDVQWIPEEEGDTLSGMEVTVKFPELAVL